MTCQNCGDLGMYWGVFGGIWGRFWSEMCNVKCAQIPGGLWQEIGQEKPAQNLAGWFGPGGDLFLENFVAYKFA